MDIKIIVKYLTLLELPLDEFLTIEKIKDNYRKLTHIYHPDSSNDRYKDGRKFIELKEAFDYVSTHIDEINEQLGNKTSKEEPRVKEATKQETYEPTSTPKSYRKKKRKVALFISLGAVVVIALSVVLPISIINNNKCRHSFSFAGDTATCETSGQKTYRCDYCGFEVGSTSKALGHNFIISSSKDATCTENGYANYECSRCGKIKTDTFNAFGHDYSKDFYCKKCDTPYATMRGSYFVPFTIKCYYSSHSDLLDSQITIKSVQRHYANWDYGTSYWGATINGKIDYRNWSSLARFRWKIQRDDGTIIVDEIEKIDTKYLEGDDFTCKFYSESKVTLKRGATYNFIFTDATATG